MRHFLYLKSNKSGIGDRLLDLMLVYTYSQYLNCEKLYLHWTEDNVDMTGNKSIYSTIRREKTPFRSVDYLLKNPNIAKEMGKNGRQKILKDWNWECEASKLLNLYDNLNYENNSNY